MNEDEITPFANCPALDGYHCQTNSLRKIFHYHQRPLSEDMILGLGGGMGFMYWQQKGIPPFIGGRGNVKNFFQDFGNRVGVTITVSSTSSERKAERTLLETLAREEPVMVYADMGLLPWFDLPEDYHFGGHTFVICGYNGRDTVLASDMEQKASELKKGFYYPISLKQLREARNSLYKPFPPKNAYLEFDFRDFHLPNEEEVYTAITQTGDSMLHPPISNFGVKGIRRSAHEVAKWPTIFTEHELRMNLFTLYVFIEIGGTGGGCFRYMYSRFLTEAAAITSNTALEKAAQMMFTSGKLFSELGHLFVDAETAPNLRERIKAAQEQFITIAELEEETFQYLAENIPTPPKP